MIISQTWMPLLVSAIRDAAIYNEGLLRSETLRNRSDYEEHLMVLMQFFEQVKEEYRKVEREVGVSLADILHDDGESTPPTQLPPRE